MAVPLPAARWDVWPEPCRGAALGPRRTVGACRGAPGRTGAAERGEEMETAFGFSFWHL